MSSTLNPSPRVIGTFSTLDTYLTKSNCVIIVKISCSAIYVFDTVDSEKEFF
jgi:hypothetical protein